MQVNSQNFRQIESIQLSDCITCIDTSKDSIAVGCLDDTLYIWEANLQNLKKQPRFTNQGNSMGIIDVSFDRNSTYLTVSHMDSTIKVYPIGTFLPKNYQCNVMQNWKVSSLNGFIATCGDLGRINIYSLTSPESNKKIDLGDIFLTAITSNKTEDFIAAGNNNGDLYIVKIPQIKELNNVTHKNKEKVAALKPHYKLIRQLVFLEDSSKLLTASDDCSIKIIDISSEKVVSVLEGHKQAVSSISPQQNDPRIVFSSSFDKTIKCWDLRMKSCVGTAVTASPLWDIKSMGNHLLAGGENGILNIYSIE